MNKLDTRLGFKFLLSVLPDAKSKPIAQQRYLTHNHAKAAARKLLPFYVKSHGPNVAINIQYHDYIKEEHRGRVRTR